MVPELSGIGVTAIYAGLRPATERKDYIIEALQTQNWITVGGIRSTGLTAALGIARHVATLYEETFELTAQGARPDLDTGAQISPNICPAPIWPAARWSATASS